MFEREAALALGRVVRREEDVESFVRVYLFLCIKGNSTSHRNMLQSANSCRFVYAVEINKISH